MPHPTLAKRHVLISLSRCQRYEHLPCGLGVVAQAEPLDAVDRGQRERSQELLALVWT